MDFIPVVKPAHGTQARNETKKVQKLDSVPEIVSSQGF